MAKMFPSNGPRSTAEQSSAEAVLYNAFKSGLSGQWVVIHGLQWIARNAHGKRTDGECDFLLFNPKVGLLLLEAKTGNYRYDRESNAWRNASAATDNPYEQARRQLYEVVRFLEERVPAWAERKPAFAYGVALPHTVRLPEHLPPDVSERNTLLAPDLKCLEQKVTRMIRDVSERVGEVKPLELVDTLLPEFGIVEALGGRMAADEAAMVRLTEMQVAAVMGMLSNRRLLVQGCCGTGKTMVAVEAARRLAAQGKRVLLLCYNRYLEGELQRQIRVQGMEVMRYHAICEKVIREAGSEVPECPPESEKEAVIGYYEDDLPNAFAEALALSHVRYDAVVVDEAQDMRPHWWVTLEELLADRTASGLYVFCDPAQDLYGKSGGGYPFTEPVMRLPFNCRNTRAIARWVTQETGIETNVSDMMPEGEVPVVVRCRDSADEQGKVIECLTRLVEDEGVAPERITVLGYHVFEKTMFAGQEGKTGVRVVKYSEPDAGGAPSLGCCVRYSTIHSFKGLEADIVLLLGVGAKHHMLNADQARTLVYVGATRAKLRLYVFCR